ncbi:MAG: HigA family addiction module antitoxin [Rectinema sp.]
MATKYENQYDPETVSIPGTTLAEALEERHMTQAELSERMGRPKKTISEILNGKAAITPETALQLERVLGVPASFWNNRQRMYDESVARMREAESLEKYVSWLDSFPCVGDMVKEGWLPPRKKPVLVLDALLAFFGVNSPEEWESIWSKPKLRAALRDSKSYKTDSFALAAYLRKAEIEAFKIECAPFEKTVFRATLEEIKTLTTDEPDTWEKKIESRCATVGVAVVFVPLVKGVHVSGAVRWMTQNRALMALSLRGKKEDIFWFSFFHEAGHLLLHDKKEVFIESKDKKSAEEKEADDFACNFLIRDAEWKAFLRANPTPTHGAIMRFAHQKKISPAIVLGRLQHEDIVPQASLLNAMKRSISIA